MLICRQRREAMAPCGDVMGKLEKACETVKWTVEDSPNLGNESCDGVSLVETLGARGCASSLGCEACGWV